MVRGFLKPLACLDRKDGLAVWAAYAEGLVEASWLHKGHPLLHHSVQHMDHDFLGDSKEDKAGAMMRLGSNSMGATFKDEDGKLSSHA